MRREVEAMRRLADERFQAARQMEVLREKNEKLIRAYRQAEKAAAALRQNEERLRLAYQADMSSQQ